MPAGKPPSAARRPADVPEARRALLNNAQVSAANLAESLAVDFNILLPRAFPDIGPADAHAIASMPGITRRMQAAGQWLAAHAKARPIAALAKSPSDTVRGIACFALACMPARAFPQRLQRLRPFADDDHFGVREWAWLSHRPHVIDRLPDALSALSAWVQSPRPNLRRCAIEICRPRGVWCAHLNALQAEPQLALGLLEPLINEPERYVQKSIANWLNDASRSRPEWVRSLCQQWLQRSNTPATRWICARGCRSLSTGR